MEKKQISQYELLRSGIDNKTLHHIKNGYHITTGTLEKLCTALKCRPNDVITFVKEK